MGNDVAAWRAAFVDVLQEFRSAGRRWKRWQVERVVRAAGEAGMVRSVLDAAKVGDRTGVRFGDVRVVREALWGCRMLMLRAEGEEAEMHDEIRSALRLAEQIAEQCDEKAHKELLRVGEKDPRVQPDCIGVLLELALSTGEPDTVKVKRYAERLVTNLENGVGDSIDETEQKLHDAGKAAAVSDYEMKRWVPVWHALTHAIETLGKDMPRRQVAETRAQVLKDRIQILANTITESDDPAKEKRMGLRWWRKALEAHKG